MLTHARLHAGPACGEGPVILFVHGGFHGAWCWANIIEYLGTSRVAAAAIDLRGHGGLPQSPSFISQGSAAMIADVCEAAATLPRPLFLAGHSLGALIAMKAAASLSPEGLILLAPAVSAGGPRLHTLPRFPATQAIAPPPKDRARKWFMSGASSSLDAYLPQLCPESPTLLNECFHDGIDAPPDSISCPILCLSGGKDDSPLHPAGQDQAIAARYNAALRVVPASGHCLMLDDGWRETAIAIHDWVKNT